MAQPNKLSTLLHRKTNKITRVLIYAFLEWTLIFFLLLNSLFSYLILKFALYFGLKPPCLLCSRLDHLLDSHKRNKPTFSSYSDIICEQHAADISKLGYCSHHQKLVESSNMCDDCSSPSSSNDPDLRNCSCCDGVLINPITKEEAASSSLDFVIKERELLGDCFTDQNVQFGSDQSDDHHQPKFGYQILDDGDEEDEDESKDEQVVFKAEKEPLLENNNNSEVNGEIVSFTTQNLCPDMLPQHLEFYIDHDDYRLIPVEFINEDDLINVESISEEVSRVVVGEEEKKGTSEFSREFELVFELGCDVKSNTKDLLSIQEEEDDVVIENLNIPKDEEKMVSDKFELVFEAQNSQNYEDEENKGESENFELLYEENGIPSGFKSENIHILMHEIKMEEGSDKYELIFEGNELLADFESENLQNPKDEKKEMVFEGDELVAECVIINTSSAYEEEKSTIIHKDEEEEDNSLLSQPLKEQEETAAADSKPVSEEQDCNNQAIEDDSQAATEIPFNASVSKEDNATLHSETDETDTEEKDQNPTEKLLFQEYEANLASLMRSYEIEIETEKIQNSTDDLLIVVDEPPTPCKQEGRAFTDNVVSHDAEISERSPNANVSMFDIEVEEERVPDTPTSSESLHKKLLLLGRRESATEESLDGMSMISEQGSAGETVEKLKVDLLTERKTLRALYKELEEERNASAIAANQTLAMITRLQEEKAIMQLEASQYQRMMEEQSEYDQEALQMMNELVVKREKEKQELEKELEIYRKKVMDYEERERMRILSRRSRRNSSASCSYGEESDGLSVDLNHEVKDHEEDVGISPHSREENGHHDTPTDAVLCLQDSLAGFEDERQAILEQLKVLEEKLFTLAEEEEEHFDSMKPFEQFCEENGKDFDVINGDDSNGFTHDVNGNHQHERRINDSMPKKLLLPLFDAVEFSESPNNGELNGNEDEFHVTKFELEKKRFAVEEEVDHVFERLQALEADREFLKHCIGSLRKGDKGLELLQEILQHLRDLKNVEVQAMKNTTDQCASV